MSGYTMGLTEILPSWSKADILDEMLSAPKSLRILTTVACDHFIAG